MSRSRLSLFVVDSDSLARFSGELQRALEEDDRDGLVGLLALEGAPAERIRTAPAAVDVFLASEAYPPSTEVFAALRNAAKERAVTLAWTSDSLALEGRLRGFDAIREDVALARLVDRLLDGHGVPWFLRRPADTCGCLSTVETKELSERLEELDDPPEELLAFARALGPLHAAVLCHDTLL
jgi:hypothetical protein